RELSLSILFTGSGFFRENEKMFWSRKAPAKKSEPKKTAPPSSAEIRAQALANARAAREALGEDTIQRIAASLSQKKNSPLEQAKARLQKLDKDRVAEEILIMLDDKD
ncbi:MAG: hypothetical protein K9G62_03090, partial [Alphaproteobacteria bacterium]|nr:hypothetical protein [Alphaproteobacteria bacterium]